MKVQVEREYEGPEWDEGTSWDGMKVQVRVYEGPEVGMG